MRSGLDFYFQHSPRFLERLKLLQKFDDNAEQNVAILNFCRQFKLLDAHIPVISHYVKTGEYDPMRAASNIEIIDYSRGLTLTSRHPRKDFKKYHQNPIGEGLHIAITGDVNVEMIKQFIDENSTKIRSALDASSSVRIKRFTPITSIEKYLKLADEYYFPTDEPMTQEQIAHKNNVSFSTASKWIKRLAPIMPQK